MSHLGDEMYQISSYDNEHFLIYLEHNTFKGMALRVVWPLIWVTGIHLFYCKWIRYK